MKKNTIFPSRATTTDNAGGKKSCVFKFHFFDPPMVADEGDNGSKSLTSKKTKKKKNKKSTTSEDSDCLPLESVINGIDDPPVPSQMEHMCSTVEMDNTAVTSSVVKKSNNQTKNKKSSKGTKKSVDDDDIDIDAMVKALDAKAVLTTKQMVTTSSPHKTTTNNTTMVGRTAVPKKKTDIKTPSTASFSFKSHKDPTLTNEQKDLMNRYRQRAIAGPRRTTATATTITAAMTTSFASTNGPESVNPFSFGFSVT